MSSSTRYPVLLAGALLVALVLLVWRPWEGAPAKEASAEADLQLVRPVRPTRPPVPGQDRPAPTPEPSEPPGMAELRAQTYAQARSDGREQPGDAAFRATIDAFIEYNRKFAEAQAQAEGITVDEVRELTYFGFLVMETQRWSEVEDIVGQPLSAEERQLGEELMHRFNKEFKTGMRALVQRGADADERWQLIRATQANYKREYFALTGMDAAQLDDLLAGDITRTGAPIDTPPPDEITENPDTPTAEPSKPPK